MTTVYVVRCGKNVEAVFSTKELAEEYIKAPVLIQDSQYVDYPNLIEEEDYSINEYKFDPKPYLTMQNLTYYWECKVNLRTSYNGSRNSGDYSVIKKAIAKEDLHKLHSYVRDVNYFINNSTISELDAIKTSYNDYLDYVRKSNKNNKVNWNRVAAFLPNDDL